MTLSIEARVELGLTGLGAVQKPTAGSAEVWQFKSSSESLKLRSGPATGADGNCPARSRQRARQHRRLRDAEFGDNSGITRG